MGIAYGSELDAPENTTSDDPVAATIGEEVRKDVFACVDVIVRNGEDVYAHCGTVIPDITVD